MMNALRILIQFVEGEKVGHYYLPHGAGVAFSRNLYRWSPQIRQEDGFLRLVWGLGTRAVDQVADDYPRLVALSHPTLHPTADVRSIRRYSQQNVDVIDLESNQFRTIPAKRSSIGVIHHYAISCKSNRTVTWQPCGQYGRT